METINALLIFLKGVLFTTLGHMVWLLGLLFIFGLILYLLARFTRTVFVKTVGQRFDVLVTGWVGVPIHELGHAIFCVIFRHRIVKIKLYSPNTTDGTLGYVQHTYNPKSTYQKIGNFFIGVGPIIFGALVLYALLYWLLPTTAGIFSGLDTHGQHLVQGVRGNFGGLLFDFWASAQSTLRAILSTSNFSNWRFWVFFYLSLCVASHMELSPPDIKGAWRGLISLFLFLFFFNLIVFAIDGTSVSNLFSGWWSNLKLESHAAGINRGVGTFGSLFVLATVISAINFVFSYVVLSLYALFRYGRLVNPFW